MKHRIVHTLQKYFLNPPIKLALALGLPLPGYALLETKRTEDGEATAHASRRWTSRKSVLASGRAWHERGVRPQH
jgi:hypothetical protein